jgi:hypothetical protein
MAPQTPSFWHRSVLATFAGVIVGIIVVVIVETLGHTIFPPPDGVNLRNSEELAAIMDTIPMEAKVAVLIAWFCGVFAGGVTALKMSRGDAWPAWAVAAALYTGSLITMFQIPHPIWMIAGSMIVTIAGVWAAIKVAGP